MKVKKGNKYYCKKDVIMSYDSEKAFTKGKIYLSEQDNCLTNNQGNKQHYVDDDCIDDWRTSDYFEPYSTNRVNHPDHYNKHPSGIECIDIARYYCFSIGNAIKYLWRAGLKKEEGISDKKKEIEDLNKAIWYIQDRIKELENENNKIK